MDNPKRLSSVRDLEQVFCRALVAAHLICGTLEHAEQAVFEGIDRWNPDKEPEHQLILHVIEAAAHADTPPESHEPIVDDPYLPDELNAVLRLDQRRRSCFVLRNLIGLPSSDCARLLRLPLNEIDEYNVSALQCLALSSKRCQEKRANQSGQHSTRN